MNKRRKAQIFSLVLAFLMLASVIPGTFLKPVSAQTYPTKIVISDYRTPYNCSGQFLLFQGFPYTLVMNLTYQDDANTTVDVDSNVLATIEYYYNGQWVTVYKTPDPGFSVTHGTATILIDSQHSPGYYNASVLGFDPRTIPQGVTKLRITFNDRVYDVTTGTEFTVEFPFIVTYNITTQSTWTAGYKDSTGTAKYDQPILGFPFDINVTVQYRDCLINSTYVNVNLPDPSNLTVVLQNQSFVWWDSNGTAIDLGNGNLQLQFDSANSNTTNGTYVFKADGLLASPSNPDDWGVINEPIPEKIIVTDNENNLVAENSNPDFHIWPIVIKLTNVTYTNNVIYKNIPFDLSATAQVYVNISGTLYNFTSPDTVYFHQLYIVDGNGNVLGNYSYAVLDSNGEVSHTFTSLVTDADYVNVTTWANVTWPYTQLYDSASAASFNYSPNYIPDVVQIHVKSWDIEINTNITCAGYTCTEFSVGVNQTLNITVGVNQTLNISVHYPIEPYQVTSTANYSILLNGVEVYSGTINIVNNNGSVVIPVNFNETGTVTIKVWDETYHPDANNVTLTVDDWTLGYDYNVTQYPDTYNIPDTRFYVGIPGNLSMTIYYNEPCPVNSTLSVTVTAPNGTVYGPYEFPVNDATNASFTLPETFTFDTPGYAIVNVTDEATGKWVSFNVPVKDWGIYVDSTPESLTVGKAEPLTVEVRESLYFPGNQVVNVKLYLPDGQILSENITLQGSSYTANGGYYGVLTFTNVNSTLPGLARIVVTDLTFGKTAVKYLPVYPNGEITGRWIDVKVTPEKSPVYAYVENSLRIDAQYYYNMGSGAYEDGVNSYVNVTIIDADGSTYTLTNVPVIDGVVVIPDYDIPVNGTGNIYVELVDAINSSIRGVAEIPVENWQVTFDIATNGPVYQYVDNILKVTVHVPAGVPVDVNVSGTIYTGVTDGQVISIPLVEPVADIPVNIVATYYNPVARKAYEVGSASETIHVRPWHVELEYTPTEIYQYIPDTLTVTVTPVDNETGDVIPLNIDVTLYNETLDVVATGTNGVSIPIQDDLGAGLIYFVDASYNGHPLLVLEPVVIETRGWYIDVETQITSPAYTASDYLWAGVPASITFTAVTYDEETNTPVALPVDIPVNVTYEGMPFTGLNSVTIPLTSPEVPSEAFHVEASYMDISYVNDFVIPVKDWSIYINAYPSKLYADLPQQLTLIIGYSAGIESTATVDVGGSTYTAHVEPVGEDSAIAVVNVGEITATEGYVRVTVTDQYGKTATLKIPVVSWDIAVTSNVNFVYTNVSTDISVDVRYSDSMLDGTADVHMILPDGTELFQTVTVLDGKATATFTGVVADMPGNITIYAEDVASGKMSDNLTIEVHDWHIEASVSPTEWYTYMPQDYTVTVTYIDDVTMGIADIDGTVVVDYNFTGVTGSETITVTGGEGSVTLSGIATPNAGEAEIILTDADHGKSVPLSVLIHGWSVKVTYPTELYVAAGYQNPIQVGFEYIADNNETVPYTGNTTIIIQLPGNITLTANVNSSPVDFGALELNETGVGNITVYANDYPAIQFVGTIEVKNLLEMSVLTPRIYENVPTEVMLNITYNGGDYNDLDVYIEGQNITFTTTDGQIWTAEVALPAGNYTVVAYDMAHNVTVTGELHVAPWHLEIVPSLDTISAGNLVPINFTVTAIDDETNGTADIDALIHIEITFSDPAVIPGGTFVVADFNLVNGTYTFEKDLFAPAPGNFTVKAIAVDYGKSAETTVEVIAPTVPPTYVYVDIVEEGQLTAPNDTVVIYWSLDGEHYFPAYNYLTQSVVRVDASESGRVVFPLFPKDQFDLYIIAVPDFIAKLYPVITSELIEDTNTTVDSWYEYNVTAVNETIIASVNVYQKVTTEGWSYKIPQAPGYVRIKPPVSVYTVAPYTSYEFVHEEELYNATDSTSITFTFTPTEYFELIKLTNMSIQPAQYGTCFDFKALVYMKYINVSEQFDEQFQTFEENVQTMVSNLPYITDDQKEELIQEIINEALAYKEAITGAYTDEPIPISGAAVQIHIDNTAIATVEPTNGTTNEEGVVEFKVCSAVPMSATPEELLGYMGDVTVWATYDNMTSESYTISFGGIGSISGDVVDPNNNLLPGATVELWIEDNGEWVIAKDYAGNELRTTTDGHGHYSFDVPASPSGTFYRVVAYYGDGTGYADAIVYPFKTTTADVVVSRYGAGELTGLGAFLQDVQTHNTKVVLGKNALTSVDYQAMAFIFELIGVKPTYTDKDIDVSALTSDDMLIAVGGPAVNEITAYYQEMAPVKMVTNDDSISIVVDNETVANWTAPTPWWNVTEGYWVIQKVVDSDTGATVYMIYGTDADSTWAAAYYFSQHFAELQGKNYVVGYWKDTDGIIFSPGFLKFSSDDTNGFSPTDEIGIVVEG